MIEISASTHACNTLHLLEARAGIWQSLQCWESRTGKEAAAFVVISSQNNLLRVVALRPLQVARGSFGPMISGSLGSYGTELEDKSSNIY